MIYKYQQLKMSGPMNSHSITDYILKLEKINVESHTKIEQLKKLYAQAEDEKVDALNALNDLKVICRREIPMTQSEKEKATLYKTTERPLMKNQMNGELADFLIELADKTNDFYKDAAYRRGAEIVRNLNEDVTCGDNIIHLKGIGRSIAAKVDEYLDTYFDDDYQPGDESDDESVASNDVSSDDDSYSDASSYDDYRMTFHTNVIIADELANLGALEKCAGASDWKVKAYTKAAKLIDNLTYEVLNGTDLMKLDGIGQGIANKVDEIIQHGTTRRAHDLKQSYPDECN